MSFNWWCDDCGRDMTFQQAQCNCLWYGNACDDNAIPFYKDVSFTLLFLYQICVV